MNFVSVADDDSCGTKGGFKTRPYKLRDRDLLWVRNLRDADVDERISSLDFVSRLAQRRFVYLVAVCVLDPNLRPLLPPFLRFEMAWLRSSQSASAMYLSPLILIFQVIKITFGPQVYVGLLRFLTARSS